MTTHNTLKVLIDTREQRPFTFPKSVKGKRTLTIETERASLPTGDYSLAGFAGRRGELFGLAIERKASLDELAGNLTRDRARLEREFLRLSLYRTRLLIVCEPRDAVHSGQLRSRIHPRALLGSIDAIAEKYNVPTFYCNGAEEGARLALDALRRFWQRANGIGARRADDPRKEPARVSAWQWAETQRRIADLEGAIEYLTGNVQLDTIDGEEGAA